MGLANIFTAWLHYLVAWCATISINSTIGLMDWCTKTFNHHLCF